MRIQRRRFKKLRLRSSLHMAQNRLLSASRGFGTSVGIVEDKPRLVFTLMGMWLFSDERSNQIELLTSYLPVVVIPSGQP